MEGGEDYFVQFVGPFHFSDLLCLIHFQFGVSSCLFLGEVLKLSVPQLTVFISQPEAAAKYIRELENALKRYTVLSITLTNVFLYIMLFIYCSFLI